MTEKPKTKFVTDRFLNKHRVYPAKKTDVWLEEQAQELERIAFGLGASKMERAEEDILKLVVVVRGGKTEGVEK